jgi:hypothetical protein
MDDAQVNALIAAARPAANSGSDVWADIGGLYEEKAFQRRIDALTNPGAYAATRTTALDAIKLASQTAFKTAYDGYITAGLSPDMAKDNAQMSARSEYGNQLRVFNLQFGQGTDQIFQGSTANLGTMGRQGTLALAGARRAPARRAPARRAPAARSAASRSAAAKKGAATKRRNAKK